MAGGEMDGLRHHRGAFVDPVTRAAYAQLMRDVLGVETDLAASPVGPWTPFALFEPGGGCVGNVEAALLPLVVDGAETEAAGIRSVAVDPAWRGRGLFRHLMEEALSWCDAEAAETVFLYTEEPVLYERFGFRSLPQHAFVGPAPVPTAGPMARRLDLGQPEDRTIISAVVARRRPLSSQCALGVDAGLFMANVAKDETLTIVHTAQPETLIVYALDDDGFILADVVAPAIPDLATILGMLGVSPQSVTTLFPPDRLGWHGKPTLDDTGLMIRGTLPVALSRPFMFPPTVEF